MRFTEQKLVPGLQRTGRVLWQVPIFTQRFSMVVLGVFLSFLTVASVILRYFLKLPFLGVEELLLYVVFWYYLFGAAHATYERSHIRGGGLPELLKKYPRFSAWFQAGIIAISLGLSLVAVSWSYEMFTWTLRVGPTTPLLLLPQAWAQLSLLVAFPLMSLYFLTELIDSVRGIIRG